MAIVEKKGDSRTRSIRVDKAIDDEVIYEAEHHNTSTSNLIEQILLSYLNHTRYVEDTSSLTIQPDTMTIFLKYLDEEDLEKIGEEVGRTIPERRFLRRGIVINEKAVLDHLLNVFGSSDNWFQVSYHEGKRPYLYIRNSLGSKWIVFIEAFIRAFYKLLDVEVESIRIGDNLQIIL
jgi:hypothetical protein